jgi:hypothetical protein
MAIFVEYKRDEFGEWLFIVERVREDHQKTYYVYNRGTNKHTGRDEWKYKPGDYITPEHWHTILDHPDREELRGQYIEEDLGLKPLTGILKNENIILDSLLEQIKARAKFPLPAYLELGQQQLEMVLMLPKSQLFRPYVSPRGLPEFSCR